MSGKKRIIEDKDLDERMTKETKSFVKGFLTNTDPRLILQTDISLVRSRKDAKAKQRNQCLKFDNLDVEKEYFVDSLYDDYKIPVTAYVPQVLSTNTALVVFFHGGGGCLCSRSTHHCAVASLANKSKCIWLSVEYRLAPEYKYPIGFNDCLSVTKWAINNKTNVFSLDENAKVGVCGDSLGGSIAAFVSSELNLLLSFQILVYPGVETHFNEAQSAEEFQRDCYILIPEVIGYFQKLLYKNPDKIQEEAIYSKCSDYSVIPKTCVVLAELDPVRDYGLIYHNNLVSVGVYSELNTIKGVNHGFFENPLSVPNAYAEACSYILEFLLRQLI